jgi:ribosomal protein S18 acetylase RimI-like enzyme
MRRLARPSDIDQVFAIYAHPRVNPYLTHAVDNIAVFERIYDGLVASGLFVWEVDGRIAGMGRVIFHEGRASHAALLSTIAVAPDLHGTGVAREMLEDTIARLRSTGLVRLELYVEADNPRGQAFYRKLGFEVEGVCRKGWRHADGSYVDDILMAMLL